MEKMRDKCGEVSNDGLHDDYMYRLQQSIKEVDPKEFINELKRKKMNLIDVYVTEILGEPYFEYNRWWLPVMIDVYGGVDKSNLMFNSKESALSVKVGDKFLK